MKAIVYRDYGSPNVLKCEELEKPIPRDNEVLIKVRAASINPLDWRVLRGRPYFLRVILGLRKPRDTRPGHDVAGVVEGLGKSIQRFKPGDEVFGVCVGSLADYACASESKLAFKPASVSFDQAASVPVAALTALQGLRDHGQIQPGKKVLINGAAGGVGTFAVQIAKALGANVTGVCSTSHVDTVRAIGADRVIDYTREDFTKGTERYDLILDNAGNHSLSACRRVLIPGGRLVLVGGKRIGVLLARALLAPVMSWFGNKKLGFFVANVNEKDLTTLAAMMESGKLRPVIERRCTLSEVPQAIRYLEQGHAGGKVIVPME